MPDTRSLLRIICFALLVNVCFPQAPDCHAQTQGSLEHAQLLNEQSLDLYKQGQYSKAQDLAQKALAIRERLLGRYHEDVAESLNNLSIIYIKIGRYDSAEPMLTRALEIRLRVLGSRHPDYAQSLNSLAGLYKTTGRYREAERLYTEALNIRINVLGRTHPDVANSLNNIATLYDTTGRYSEAEPLYLEALNIRRNAFGEKHPLYATTLNNLARLYKVTGRYKKAEEAYLRVIDIKKNVLGEKHPDYAISLNNLAALYHSYGHPEDAEKLYLKASVIFKVALGENHPTYAISLNNLGMVLDNTGQYEKAVTAFRQAMQIYEQATGKDSADYANTLNNLAVLYRTIGNYSEAERLSLEALDIRRRVLGEHHPDYATSLDSLAILYEATGQFDKSMEYISRCMSVEQANLAHMLSVSSELAMRDYLSTLGAPYARLLTMSFARAKTNEAPAAASTALAWTLNRKAVILDTLMRFRELQTLVTDDDVVRRLIRRLQYLRQRIASLPLELKGDPDDARVTDEIASLRDEVDRLETQLNRVLSARQKWSEPPDVSVDAVKRQLKAGEALIQFVRSDIFDFKAKREEPRWKSQHYFAFVLTPNAGTPPRMVDLGEAKTIDDAINELRGKIVGFKEDWQAGKFSGDDTLKSESTEEASYRSAAKKLYDLLFARVGLDTGSASTLYVAPDDQLNLVPFEGLVDAEGNYLIEKYRFAYLSSGRDLLRRSVSQGRGAFIFADPDFDEPFELRKRNARLLASDFARLQANAASPTRQNSVAKTGSQKVKGGNWQRLADSSKEAESVQHDLEGAVYLVNGKLHTYLRERALEDVFKLVHSPRVLHVSTHGFFLEDDADEFSQGRLDTASGNPALIGQELLRRADEPLLTSGLVLAGANRIGQCKEADCSTVDDGWLTAEEISLMDLRGTELVVLSACGSGLGVISPGEGVYGLRRAFQNAGARTIISTLFEVPEIESGKIMRNFYRALKSRKGKLDALREAQLQMIAEQRRQKGAAHPFFWAGFILSGEAE